MRITSRAKYGIAAMTYLASQYDSGRQVPLVEIADTLSVSKVYMEQIIGMLKLSGCLIAVKGPYGGYRLVKAPDQIAAYDFMRCLDPSMFEPVKLSMQEPLLSLEQAMETMLFSPLEQSINIRHVSIIVFHKPSRAQLRHLPDSKGLRDDALTSKTVRICKSGF